MKRLLPILVAAFLIVGGGAWLLMPGSNSADGLPELGAANAQSSAPADLSLVEEMNIGNEDAAVTVIEYASYTCPHCRRFHEGPFKQLKADYIDTGKINFVYREVYFDRFGLWASMVARCGGEERFFGISDLIYAQQSEWTAGGDPAVIAGNLRRSGLTAGLTNEELDACFSDGAKAQALVAWWEANGEEDGVRSTPSFVINGTTYNNMSYEELSGLIENAL